MATPLNDSQIQENLAQLPEWSLTKGDKGEEKIHRAYKFADFTTAFAFMSACAIEAEKLNHHPEWSNVYWNISIDLTTHDAGGLTELDFQLASKMEAHAKKLL